MSEVTLYRVTVDGKPTHYGPYESISVARNVASRMYGGWWQGRNSATRSREFYVHETSSYIKKDAHYTIQKLIPVLQMTDIGTFELAMAWRNV